MSFAFGRTPAFVRDGGTIGAVVSMERILRSPIAFLNLSLPEHGYHAPNENFDWGQAAGGIAAFARYLEEVASGAPFGPGVSAKGLVRGADGTVRCAWAGADPLYLRYHDEEWGFPVADDRRLFEKVCLEGFQAGLSWLTILRKRENFRKAFAGFDPVRVARFDSRAVTRLLADAGIVRHRGKIESTIHNARQALALRRELGSLAAYFWRLGAGARPTGRAASPGPSCARCRRRPRPSPSAATCAPAAGPSWDRRPSTRSCRPWGS